LANAKFVSRDRAEAVQVFPMCRQGYNHLLVEHAVRVGWFNSPHRTEPEFEKRCIDAARTAKMIPHGAKMDSIREESRGKQLGQKDLFFQTGSVARAYLQNFLEYQKHPIWEFYNKASELIDKQYKFYRDLKLDPENDKVLMAAREFTSTAIHWMQSMSEFHRDMIYKVYWLDELSNTVPIQDTSGMREAEGFSEIEDEDDGDFLDLTSGDD
jgi:hypothetical protein